jgi:hypothetical protein
MDGDGRPASTEDSTLEVDEALLSRLALISDRPLADRAPAFRQLHDELRSELEAADGEHTGATPTRSA